MVRSGAWKLWVPLALAGCIDVPALTFRDAPDVSGSWDASNDARRSEDGNVPAVDARATPDLGPPRADAGAKDASEVVPADARVPPPDGERTSPEPDAVRPPSDAAPVPPDAVRPPSDAAPVPPDALPVPLDARLVADAFEPSPDVLAPAPDKGALTDAAAPPPPDLGEPAPDAAVPPLPDVGPPGPEAPEIIVVAGPAPGGRFGAAFAVVPDQNGDAAADVVVGSPQDDDVGGGTVYLIDGRTGDVLNEVTAGEGAVGFGESLTALDLLGDGTLEVVVGSPRGDAGRGRLDAYRLPGFDPRGDFVGEQGGGAFGTAMAVTLSANDRRTPLLGVTAPGQAFSPRIYLIGGVESAPGVFDLARLDRYNLDPDWVDFGRAIVAIPADNGRDPDDFIVSAHSGLSGDGRIIRFNRANEERILADYRPEGITADAGAALAVFQAPSRVLFVGDAGSGAGRVTAFWVDLENLVRPIASFAAPERAARFGAALLAVPRWPPSPDAVPALCVGSPGDVGVAGRIDCLGYSGGFGGMANPPELLFSLDGRVGTAFGSALGAASVPDPDGSFLLVVGAPETRSAEGLRLGALHLVRFPATR
jgi:hypothetical protein